jgi:hypothetical protein
MEFFSLFPSQQQLSKINFLFLKMFFFFSVRADAGTTGEGGRGGREGGRCVRADASFLPEVTSKRTLQCVQVTDAPAAIIRPSVRPKTSA